jgi:hypothetical protein
MFPEKDANPRGKVDVKDGRKEQMKGKCHLLASWRFFSDDWGF